MVRCATNCLGISKCLESGHCSGCVSVFMCVVCVGWSVCGSVTYGIRPLVSCLPAWFRFAQCLRRYRDTRLAFPHVVNAGKYSTTFFAVLFKSLYSAYRCESLIFLCLSVCLFFCLSVLVLTISKFSVSLPLCVNDITVVIIFCMSVFLSVCASVCFNTYYQLSINKCSCSVYGYHCVSL